MNLEPAIELRDLCFTAKERRILHNLNGVFYKGKITTLVGPSGAGKTTLLKMCNGLLAPTSGDIFIGNQPIQEYEPTTLRRKVGIALQSAPILRSSVYENLALPRTLQGEHLTEKEAVSALENVQLDASFYIAKQQSYQVDKNRGCLSLGHLLTNQIFYCLMKSLQRLTQHP